MALDQRESALGPQDAHRRVEPVGKDAVRRNDRDGHVVDEPHAGRGVHDVRVAPPVDVEMLRLVA